ncbi:MAG: NrdH-redoxin [Candidatus Diapherotrites archaeon]|uniref:NrdH-redoxin n=1 Tax=Candidatus Iainarchaeum sp. TaxID=3101447 RepID=A0A2D6LZW7_9ARCH|nr:NrdH-redoxin [Candidatus Diapherotrites archaeon]|tara:strand:+ start:6157 stop:7305 length:1149 start_codon:yes stop_codon:yes gene_type:complete
MKKLFALLFLLIVLLLPITALADTDASTCDTDIDEVKVYYFWSENCAECANGTEFLNGLEGKYGGKIEVQYLRAEDNLELFNQMAESHGAATQWLPVTFIPCCNWHVVGFNEEIGKEIDKHIEDKHNDPVCKEDDYVLVPILGKIEMKNISLPLFTITLGVLDGFNPCAMFILLILLSLLIHTKSRKRTAFVAGTFVFFSGLVYFLFMTLWLNIFLFFGYSNIIRTVLALFALGVGLINVKDFFFFKKGISLSIPDSVKPGIFKKMRGIVQSKEWPIIIFGTIFLAFSVNLFEFLCTAGFPAIFTKVLASQNLEPIMYYFYMLLYIIFYMIDDAIMIAIAVITLRSQRLTEVGGKWLKLISGLVMLGLGLALLFAPELLTFV